MICTPFSVTTALEFRREPSGSPFRTQRNDGGFAPAGSGKLCVTVTGAPVARSNCFGPKTRNVGSGIVSSDTLIAALMGPDSVATSVSVAATQLRHDEIMGLGLDHTVNRQYLSTVTNSNVSETSAGVYLKNQTYWHEKVRTIAGLRGDFIHNDVTMLDTATR